MHACVAGGGVGGWVLGGGGGGMRACVETCYVVRLENNIDRPKCVFGRLKSNSAGDYFYLIISPETIERHPWQVSENHKPREGNWVVRWVPDETQD